MILNLATKYLVNSLILDAFLLKRLYFLPQLQRFILFWRPRNDSDLFLYIDQYIFLMLMFNQGIITSFFLKKKTYKDKEASIEIVFLGIRALTVWGYKKRQHNGVIPGFWFLFNLRKFFISQGRFPLIWSLRRAKYPEYFCFSFSFPFTISFKKDLLTLWFFKYMSANIFKINLILGFNSGILLLNVWFLAFYHFPLNFFKRRKRKK